MKIEATKRRGEMYTAYIYILRETVDTERHFEGEVRYVGKAKDPETRFFQHLNGAREGSKKALGNWIRDREKIGHPPRWDVIEKVEAETNEALIPLWKEAETRWIAKFQEIGCDLLNRTKGGDGALGNKWTKEQKENLKEVRQTKGGMRGKKHSEESKQKMSRARQGKKLSKEQRLNISKGLVKANKEGRRKGPYSVRPESTQQDNTG